MYESDKSMAKLIGCVLVGILIVVVAYLAVMPRYRVWSRELAGQAELAQATYNRKIKIKEAEAAKDAAVSLAAAEVERARGVAKANGIIGDSLKNNEAYLRYLWVQGLHDGHTETVYIPTESMFPIMESTRRLQQDTAVTKK